MEEWRCSSSAIKASAQHLAPTALSPREEPPLPFEKGIAWPRIGREKSLAVLGIEPRAGVIDQVMMTYIILGSVAEKRLARAFGDENV
jgi:hypothetical protein